MYTYIAGSCCEDDLQCNFFCLHCCVVEVRTLSSLPGGTGLGVMLHWPIRFKSPLQFEKTTHGLRGFLVYVEIGVDPSRLPPIECLAISALGLCSLGSICPVGGRMVEKSLLSSAWQNHSKNGESLHSHTAAPCPRLRSYAANSTNTFAIDSPRVRA